MEGAVGRGGSFGGVRGALEAAGAEGGVRVGRGGNLAALGAFIVLGGLGAGGSVVGGGGSPPLSFSSRFETGETPAGAEGGAIAESPFFFKKSNTPKRSPLFSRRNRGQTYIKVVPATLHYVYS
jgi:hypothetical protein